MEHLEDVEEGRSKADQILNDRVGDFLDPALAQDNQDCDAEGVEEDTSRPAFDGPQSVHKERPQKHFVPKITMLSRQDLCLLVETLILEWQ